MDDMTNEEAISIINIIIKRYCTLDKEEIIALNTALKALEDRAKLKEETVNAISREAVFRILGQNYIHDDTQGDWEDGYYKEEIYTEIMGLTSAIPLRK